MGSSISVTGGAGDIRAECDDMIATAGLFDEAGSASADQVLHLSGYLVRPEVGLTAVLDPGGAADFEAALAQACASLTILAARCTGIGVKLRVSAACYAAADQLEGALEEGVMAVLLAPAAVLDTISQLVATGDFASLQRIVTDDPYLADEVISSAGALLGGTASASALLGSVWDDGHPVVTASPADPGADAAGPPRSVSDLVAELERRDEGKAGEIDVRIISGSPGGGRKVVVDITGTKTWSPDLQNPNVTNIETNLRAMAGEQTSYEQGVFEAMRQAGVRPDDDVLLIGHSQGGLIALEAADDAAASGEFHVAHVITAGSPIALVAARTPGSVQVLALENRNDLVPHLDGEMNPDRPNVTTVTVDHDHGSIGDNHSIEKSYLPGAADVDASDDPSIRTYLDGLGDFLDGDQVQTTPYVISRGF